MCLYPFYLKSVDSFLPCGKCVECLKTYSTEFAVRCMLEAREHSENCFVTLTYNEENCPDELSKRDLQLFIKKLRFHLSRFGISFRVFQCGEYGEKNGRPHYHLIIFGWCPDDLVYRYSDSAGEPLFNSPFLASIWGKGFIILGSVSFRSAKYCAKYMQKLAYDDSSKTKPFILSSRRPGIGGLPSTIDYIIECLETDKVYLNGIFYPIPHYYLKLLEKNPLYSDKIALIRANRAKLVLPRSEEALSFARAKASLFTGERKEKKVALENGFFDL